MAKNNPVTLIDADRLSDMGDVCSINFHKSTFDSSSYYISAVASPDGYKVVQGWFTPSDAQEMLAKMEALYAAGVLARDIKPTQISKG
ncbi:hypothetical protein [Altericista sp. CCNU0014]|uniref:hypothetical protein n=1 Tax=Altericista sp. CCNU0014 TaxID=3082949 RepID=UPI00384D6241